MKFKDVCLFFLWKKSYDKPRQHIKKHRHYFANKGLSSWSYGFSSSHMDVRVDHKETECWRINWCFWTVVLEKTLEIPLDCKETQLVYPKGNQSWMFIGRTDVEAETPILWPPEVKSWLIWKDPDAGKDWGQEEKGMTEDEMVGWHHRLDGHGFGWTLEVGWTGRPGVLQFTGSQRVGHDWVTELNWTDSFLFASFPGIPMKPALFLLMISFKSYQLSSFFFIFCLFVPHTG